MLKRDALRSLEAQRWQRVDAPWSPQGHALQTDGGDGVYLAWQEQRLGPFFLTRVRADGRVIGPFEIHGTSLISAFTAARLCVLQAEIVHRGATLTADQLWHLAIPSGFPVVEADLALDRLRAVTDSLIKIADLLAESHRRRDRPVFRPKLV